MLKEYKIASILTIKASSYEEALKAAEKGLLYNCQRTKLDGELDIVYDYEDDGSALHQRVVYLPGICVEHDDEECKVC